MERFPGELLDVDCVEALRGEVMAAPAALRLRMSKDRSPVLVSGTGSSFFSLGGGGVWVRVAQCKARLPVENPHALLLVLGV